MSPSMVPNKIFGLLLLISLIILASALESHGKVEMDKFLDSANDISKSNTLNVGMFGIFSGNDAET
jgi:hypothetical protein